MTTGVGLIGFGLAGRVFHAPLFAPAGLTLAMVATSRRDEVEKHYPGTRVEADWRSVIADPGVDLVVIATPNQAHAEIAVAALDSGKHAVIDKPFAVSTAEADRVIGKAAETGLCLSIFQNRRWDADFLTLRDVIGRGDLGDIVSYTCHYDRFRPVVPVRWREEPGPGAGLLFDLGPHLIDQALVLFGRPDWIEADIMTQRDGARVDDAFHLRMGKGRLRITLSAGALVADSGRRYAVHGTGGSFVKNGLDIQEAQLNRGENPDMAGFGIEPADNHARLTLIAGEDATISRIESRPGSYVGYYAAMREAIESGAAVPVDARDSRDGLHLIEMAVEASETGRRVQLDDTWD